MSDLCFDKNKCVANIYALTKEKKIRIGELESKAGVSAGYLSRLSKNDNNSNPSIEFLCGVAETLGVSLDLLINGSFDGLTGTELYLIQFFDKLAKDTNRDELDWIKYTESYLNNNKFLTDDAGVQVLFNVDNTSNKTYLKYNSLFLNEKEITMKGNCYSAVIDNYYKSVIYVMSINSKNFIGNNFYEIYVVKRNEIYPICCTVLTCDEINKNVERLYKNIEESATHLKISTQAKSIIDTYMGVNDDIPF